MNLTPPRIEASSRQDKSSPTPKNTNETERELTLQADASLFSALFSPLLPASHELQNETVRAATPPQVVSLPAHLNDDMVLNTLVVKITQDIDGISNTMSCTLLLPHLGEVRMNATHNMSNQWQIHLAFIKVEALEYARKNQSTIIHRLREQLGSPVVLGLSLREEYTEDD